VRPPVLSASDDPPGDDTAEHFRPPEAATLDFDGDDDGDVDIDGAEDGADDAADDAAASRSEILIPEVMPLLPPRGQ
jgi:hypothetical protein